MYSSVHPDVSKVEQNNDCHRQLYEEYLQLQMGIYSS